MPMQRSTAVANEFLKKGLRQDVPITQMKLQKLVFLANGWNWAVNNDQLVSDFAEAWQYGPVFPDLYDHSKLFGSRPIPRLITPDDDDAMVFFGAVGGKESTPYKATLSAREREVVDQVWDRYRHLSAYRLSDLTHSPGSPWFEAYHQFGERSSISQVSISQHYSELMIDFPPDL